MRIREIFFLLTPILIFPVFFLYGAILSGISGNMRWEISLQYSIYLILPIISILSVAVSVFKIKTQFDLKGVLIFTMVGLVYTLLVSFFLFPQMLPSLAPLNMPLEEVYPVQIVKETMRNALLIVGIHISYVIGLFASTFGKTRTIKVLAFVGSTFALSYTVFNPLMGLFFLSII